MAKSKKTSKKSNHKAIDRKSQINNVILQAQGKFKQAKVSVIRRLVEKLKHPEKNPKQNRASKVERYQNVLNHIKHMSPKRLGLLALLTYKSGKNYLADPNSTIEQLTVGYYLESKGLTGVLDSIRAKLKLTENSNWRKSVKKLFKKKDLSRDKEKLQNETSLTESAEDNSEPKKKNKKSKQKELNDDPQNVVKSSTKKQKKQDDSINQTEIEANETDESNDSEEDDNNADEDEISLPAPTTVDDFFITADGSNYLSTAVVNRKQEEGSDDGTNDHHQRGKSFERRSKESSFFHKDDKKPVKAVNRFEGTKRKWSDEREETVQKEKQTKLDPDLHPSWQAKQKLKPTITEFKGKKITFD